MTHSTLDLERQKVAKELGRIKRRLLLAEPLLTGIYALTWLAFGWAAGLQTMLSDVTANAWLLVPSISGVYFAGEYLLGLPIAFYKGYLFTQRYELSTKTTGNWIVGQLKNLVVAAVLGGIVLEGVYALLRV